MGLPIAVRVLLGVAGAGLIAWRLWSRWQAAGAYVNAQAEQTRAMRALHHQLLGHPSWQRLWQALAARGYRIAVHGPEPGAFTFGLLTLWTDRGYAFDLRDPTIRYLNAYLRGPKEIVATLVLATGEVQVRDAGFGEFPSEAL